MSKILPLLPLAFLATLGTFVLAWGEDSHSECDFPTASSVPCRTPDLTGVTPARAPDEMPTFSDLVPKGSHVECDITAGAASGPCRTVPDQPSRPDWQLGDLLAHVTPDFVSHKIEQLPTLPESGCYIVQVTQNGQVATFLREVPCQ